MNKHLYHNLFPTQVRKAKILSSSFLHDSSHIKSSAILMKDSGAFLSCDLQMIRIWLITNPLSPH
ncbi:hypothetical protein BC2926_50720 [Bacillus cereus]|nr:hypothetical protein BC2926_50720 [Bacillus cereus]